MKLARVLAVAGRISLTAGVLTLLFVAYQLWGTGIHEARAQGALSSEFEAALDEAGIEPWTDGAASSADERASDDPPPTAPPPLPDTGEAVARIQIPAIGVDKIVVEGVGVEDLKRGPGRFPETPLPGREGNAGIAGHRTTYGAPFHRLDDLEPGDEILVTTLEGSFRYLVSETLIVRPDQVEVLEDHGDDRLTLVACHPKYSAAQRIVVVAHLDGEALPGPEATAVGTETPADLPSEPAPDSLDAGAGLSGERAGAWPTVLFAFTCALIWLAAWYAAKLTKPWIAYGIGTPIFLVTLFFLFEETSRLLPANF